MNDEHENIKNTTDSLETLDLEESFGTGETSEGLSYEDNPTLGEGDKVIYNGHVTLIQRPYLGKDYDIVVSKNAVAIMYIDLEDNVYFCKQFRPPVGKEILELPAETIDKPNLSSLEHIVEGLEEECGVRIKPEQAQYLMTVGSSEGHDTELVDLFYASGPCEITGQRLGEDERIEVVKIKFDDAYKMIGTKITGSKSIILLQNEYLRRLGKYEAN
jgi:hypothetical protein